MNSNTPASLPKTYPELCAFHPPRIIKSQSSYEAASGLVDRLTHATGRLTRDQKEYLTLLRHLIGRYEEKSSHPLRLLKRLVDEHKLTKSDLSRILGRSLALGSMILNGKRTITREHSRRLAQYFGLRPDAFLT